MQDNKQADKMSKEEIIKYVDALIEQNEESYDKRLSPLLYDFFIRSNEKFNWSKKEFIEKYENFRNIVKKICISRLKMETMGRINYKERTIFLNSYLFKEYMGFPLRSSINKIINVFFHECSHATDIGTRNGKISKGFYEISYDSDLGYYINEKETMFNEYANTLYSIMISTEKPMYFGNLPIKVSETSSYSYLNLPGSIMCAAFDITEIELAKLKDKGRKDFDIYLKEKFPYMDTKLRLSVFIENLNVIYNAQKANDEQNLSLGIQNIVDAALDTINLRITKIFQQKSNVTETLERIYFDIYKIEQLLREIDGVYSLDNETKVCNADRLNTIEEIKKRIYLHKNSLEKSKFVHKEYDIECIAKKYYLKSNESLNDNTELIEKVRNSFKRQTIKERFLDSISKMKKEPELPLLVANNIVDDRVDFKSRIKHKTTMSKQNKKALDKEDILQSEKDEIEGQK